jgi:hypothetical protein
VPAAFLVGFVVGVVAMALVLILAINITASRLPQPTLPEPPSWHESRGGDA